MQNLTEDDHTNLVCDLFYAIKDALRNNGIKGEIEGICDYNAREVIEMLEENNLIQIEEW